MNIWTDGACTGNGTAHARGGCGIFIPSLDIKIAHKLDYIQPVTNNIAELMAIKLTLEWITSQTSTTSPSAPKYIIHTDSQYSINCITTWRRGWERNGLKLASNNEIKNIELIQSIWQLYDQIAHVEFKHVKAHVHSKIASELEKNNQVADDLATSCIAVKQPL